MYVKIKGGNIMTKYSLDAINALLGEGSKVKYKVDYKAVLNKEQYKAKKNGPQQALRPVCCMH